MPAQGGTHVGEVDTTALTQRGLQYATLTQSIGPVPVSAIPNQAGTLVAWIYNNGPANRGYHSFEITLSVI